MARVGTRAFTLIELLTVIAIVAVLAGLLFAVVGPAKKEAKQSVCVSNLHQIGLATGLYNNDHDGRFPATINAIEGIDTELMLGRDPDQKASDFPTPKQALQPYAKSSGVFVCSLDNGATIGLINSESKNAIVKPGPLHAYNDGTSYLFADLLKGQNPTAWRRPDQEAWACDASGYWHHPPPATPLESKGKANVLYYDLHVAQREYVTVQAQETVWPD
ncbi:type II secretion system protein [bacterium]|nr:MAG: type II secretion system protein [bacterium]